MARARLFAVVALVVLSGCAIPGGLDEFDPDREAGQIGDYAHDDVFEFDGSEGLTESQLEAVKYRSMARIEVLRGVKFRHDVELEVMERSEYRERRSGSNPASAFENELWRGTFVVDGETDVNEARDVLYGSSVQGYYLNDRIVIIADDADEIRIDRRTLVHELVHALQDQRFGLDREGDTLDAQRAETGLIEGDADYVPHLYDDRCGDTWQCLPEIGGAPADADSGSDAGDAENETAGSAALEERPFNVGLFLSIYAPYSEGSAFVDALHEREDGWRAVDRAYDDRPTSTSQVIHPERYPEDDPVDVDVPDRSSDGWEAATADGERRTETVGEATLFGALWANGAVDQPLTQGATELSPYNYSTPATDGWAGDTFLVYHDADDHNRTGHVWRLAWESEADAAEFADAYRTVVTNNGGEPVETDAAGDVDVYRIPDGEPFAGAYRVTVTGETVEIVGAPAVGDLEAIHATDGSVSASVSPSSGPSTSGPDRGHGRATAATATADG